MVKQPIHQEDIATLNFNISNKIASKYIKQKLSGTKRRNRQFHNHGVRFNHTFLG